MILSVKCDKPTFKAIEFNPGFNLVLAERTRKSKDKDSRNALGKSLLIEIIHFCLGSEIKSNRGLGAPQLNDWTFTLGLSFKGKEVSISRNTKNSRKIYLEGDFSILPMETEIDDKIGKHYLRIKNWRTSLGFLMFGLPIELSEKKYTPTFRSLISYFSRRNIGGYEDAFKHYNQQKEWDIQVNNAFLLGLNWEHASEWQEYKDKEKTLVELKKAAKQGLLEDLVGSIGELEAVKVSLKEQIKEGEDSLKSFRVHPQYNEIEKEINTLTEQIHNLVNKNNIANQIIARYKENIQEEKIVPIEKIEKVFKGVGVLFPKRVTKRFTDISQFAREISKNRKTYLLTEINRISREIKQREDKVKTLTLRRAEHMQILSTHGALEEYTALQKRHADMVSQLKAAEGRIENLRRFEEGKSALKIAKEQLLIRARRDLQDRESQKHTALKYFNAHSQYLYAEPGILSVDLVDKGFKFNVEMKRSGSHGIEHMKVFCYDLSLIKLWSTRKDMLGFLIHDTMIFEGVDERQIAKALELAKKATEGFGFQYICTMNSDMIPVKYLSKDFNINRHIAMKFTDATEDGGLLGIRF